MTQIKSYEKIKADLEFKLNTDYLTTGEYVALTSVNNALSELYKQRSNMLSYAIESTIIFTAVLSTVIYTLSVLGS
jgi:hypothetical protein